MAKPKKAIDLPNVSPAVQEAMEQEESAAERAKRIAKEAEPEEEASSDEDEDSDEAKVDPERAKMLEKEYHFDFEFESEDGNVWKGAFKHTVPTVRERRLIGIMRADQSGGQAFESLDPLTREMIMVIAYLSFTLEVKEDHPEHWARDIEAIEDYTVLQALYGRCLAHEATFLGPR